MNRDPKWIGLALKAYDACLPLYPREVREAHGEEMRQAFRDRCREVARGEQSAWRLFGRELMPDLLASAANSHVDAATRTSDRRLLIGLALLSMFALALATQPTWSARVVDLMRAANLQIVAASEKWTVRENTQAAQALSSMLVAKGDAESIAVAALVQRSLLNQDLTWSIEGDQRDYHNVQRPEAGKKATQLVARVVEWQR
jgi:hypothetical protein